MNYQKIRAVAFQCLGELSNAEAEEKDPNIPSPRTLRRLQREKEEEEKYLEAERIAKAIWPLEGNRVDFHKGSQCSPPMMGFGIGILITGSNL